jgi:hypothetical protein
VGGCVNQVPAYEQRIDELAAENGRDDDVAREQ